MDTEAPASATLAPVPAPTPLPTVETEAPALGTLAPVAEAGSTVAPSSSSGGIYAFPLGAPSADQPRDVGIPQSIRKPRDKSGGHVFRRVRVSATIVLCVFAYAPLSQALSQH